MKKAFIVSVASVIVFGVVNLIAEDKIPLEVRIQAIKGDVEIKRPDGGWEKAANGMVLKEGAQVSTGYGAEAQLIMADNSAVIVYQLTQIKIDKFFKEKAKVKTDLKLNIGKIRAQVQKIEDKINDFNVVTPTSVVSVRGTGMDVAESDRGTNVQGLVASVEVKDTALGRKELVRAGQQSNVAPGEVPTQAVVETQQKAKVDTAVVGQTAQEVQARQDVDIPEVKPGEAGKAGSVS